MDFAEFSKELDGAIVRMEKLVEQFKLMKVIEKTEDITTNGVREELLKGFLEEKFKLKVATEAAFSSLMYALHDKGIHWGANFHKELLIEKISKTWEDFQKTHRKDGRDVDMVLHLGEHSFDKTRLFYGTVHALIKHDDGVAIEWRESPYNCEPEEELTLWEKFLKGDILVTFDDEREVRFFLEKVQEEGINWNSGLKPLDSRHSSIVTILTEGEHYLYAGDGSWPLSSDRKVLFFGSISEYQEKEGNFEEKHHPFTDFFPNPLKEFLEGEARFTLRAGTRYHTLEKFLVDKGVRWNSGRPVEEFWKEPSDTYYPYYAILMRKKHDGFRLLFSSTSDSSIENMNNYTWGDLAPWFNEVLYNIH